MATFVITLGLEIYGLLPRVSLFSLVFVLSRSLYLDID